MLDVIVSSPMFGFGLSIICFELAVFIQQKVKSPIANPMLISGVLIIVLLSLSGISFEQYNNGARFITMFISPCTALLVVNIYNNLDTVKKYLLPILAGTAAAAAASMGSVYAMCKLLANGAPPKDVQDLLGHSAVSTTMNIYAHATREAKKNSARLLDKVVGND